MVTMTTNINTNMYINQLNEETQTKIAIKVAKALRKEYDFTREEMDEHVENALNSRICDIYDTVSKKELLTIINRYE